MSDLDSPAPRSARMEAPSRWTGMLAALPAPLLWLGGLLLVELLVISLFYRHGFTFECRAVAPVVLCAGLGYGVIRAIAIAGAVTVFLLSRGPALEALRAGLRPGLHRGWLGLQIAGFAAILAPLLFLADGAGQGVLSLAILLWLGGLAAAGIGAALALVPGAALGRLITALGPWTLAAIIAIAGLAPEIADVAQRLWHLDAIAEATFYASEALLKLFAADVMSEPADVALGIGEFIVLVGPQCSGVEGFALITSFLGFYIWLFRDQLSFPKVWILIPIGIFLSWCFNVVRITVLVMIGAYISPDLAVNGFHSHAGWMMFTILSVGIAVLVHSTSLFRRAGAAGHVAAPRETLPLWQDPVAARIVPFLIFMATALLSSTFAEVPGVLYPLRAAAMLAGLWLFREILMALPWRLDPLSLVAGLAIGVAWVATAPAAEAGDTALADALAAMPAAVFAIWVVTRVIGTVVLVPVIEELFFRGYVLARLDTGSMVMRVLAIAVSAGLFAALHGRWIEAAIAGVIFALLYLRARNISDAILAHAAANGVIAGWAVATGDFAVI